MAENDEVFEVEGATDQPVSNTLEKGRYKFFVKDVESHISKLKEDGKGGNKCAKLTLVVEGLKIEDYLLLQGQMSYKWKQFLYAIGIRDKRQKFEVPKKSIIGKEGLVDVGVQDSVFDDGSIVKKNKIYSYSPLQEEVAPITGVEPEIEGKSKKDELEDI